MYTHTFLFNCVYIKIVIVCKKRYKLKRRSCLMIEIYSENLFEKLNRRNNNKKKKKNYWQHKKMGFRDVRKVNLAMIFQKADVANVYKDSILKT